jgi:replicative DNA helicase
MAKAAASKPAPAPVADDPMAHAHSVECERSILALALDGRHGDVWGLVREAGGSPRSFWSRDHRLVALVVDALWMRGTPVDASSVAQAAQTTPWSEAIAAVRALDEGKAPSVEARPGTAYDDSLLPNIGGHGAIADLASTYSPATALARNVGYLVAYERQRQTIALLADLHRRARAVDGAKHVQEIAAEAANRLAIVTDNGQGVDSIGLAAERALLEHDAAAAQGDVTAASWGVPALDTLCRLTPGRLIVLAARPGCGKTSMMLQAAAATRIALGPQRVAIQTLEMPSEDLARIMIGRQLGIGRQMIERGWLSAEQRQQVAAAAAEWRANDIPVKGTGGRGTVHEVCAWARALRRRTDNRLHLVAIDYLGLLKGSHPRMERREAIGEITRELKLLTKDERICVLLLSQMNRESVKERRKPNLADLRDSGDIEQDADSVVFLWSDQVDEKPPVMLVNAFVAKNRGGEEGTRGLEFLRAYGQTFREPGGNPVPRGTRMQGEPQAGEDVLGQQPTPQQEP